MPAPSATAIPTNTSAALSVDVKMPGRKFDEASERAKIVATHRSGAVRSATAYHPAVTRHSSARNRNSRRPSLRSTRAVNRMPEMLGPASMASNA
jgi:hypothetical protein